MTIQAIETHYADCRFRSRLEARWAVFFDALRIKWEYEPQGFVVNGRPYLPDFYLPEIATWVEVKGSVATLDLDLLSNFVISSGHPILILGPIPETLYGEPCWNLLYPGPADDPDGFHDGQPYWNDGPEWSARMKPVSFFVWRTQRRLWTHYPDTSSEWSPADPTTPWLDDFSECGARSAYLDARCARFEHGETP